MCERKGRRGKEDWEEYEEGSLGNEKEKGVESVCRRNKVNKI